MISVIVDERLPEAFRLFTERVVTWYCSTYMPNMDHNLKVKVLTEDEDRNIRDDDDKVIATEMGHFSPPDTLGFDDTFLYKDLPLFVHVLFHEMSHYQLDREGKKIEDDTNYDLLETIADLKGTPMSPWERHAMESEEKHCNEGSRKAMNGFFVKNQPLVKWLIKEHTKFALEKGVVYEPFKDLDSKLPKQWKTL